jgi:fructokinase
MVGAVEGVMIRPGPVQWYPRPQAGYRKQFIETTLQEHFERLINGGQELDAIGVSMFGLIDDEVTSLVKVPRPDWLDGLNTTINFGELPAKIGRKNIPVRLVHDSTASTVGEYLEMEERERRAGGGFHPRGFVRIRVGTGVGVGRLVLGGRYESTGRVHPEAGHIHVVQHRDDWFTEQDRTCQAHKNRVCLEGLLSEQAMLARCGVDSLSAIKENDQVWDIVASYLAQLCATITDLIAPDMIVIGGRTMFDRHNQPRRELFKKIHKAFELWIGGYPRYRQTDKPKEYIRPSVVHYQAYASLVGVAELTRREYFDEQ